MKYKKKRKWNAKQVEYVANNGAVSKIYCAYYKRVYL